MAIFLLRHAETVSNAARVVQVPAAPLSPRGETQAAALARRLAGAGITRIVSSDLERARSTAEPLRAATGAALELDAGLQERNYGDVRGTPYAALDADIFAPDYEPPGGETWAAFHERVDATWARMLAAARATRGHLAVVTHGLVCERVLQAHCDAPGIGAETVAWSNTCVTVIEGDPPRTVRLLACTAHLDAPAAGGAV